VFIANEHIVGDAYYASSKTIPILKNADECPLEGPRIRCRNQVRKQ
jgi:hypothetical protein